MFGLFLFAKFRGVAQLVARVVWGHEVVGSSPATPTEKVLRLTRVCKTLQETHDSAEELELELRDTRVLIKWKMFFEMRK